MHCSANVGQGGDVAIFFGLSGTGKTTLSADPSRRLIGDDEHGWSDNGVFNFEDGCYAKVIRLSPEAEPQIYACTRRFGTILENVVFDPADAACSTSTTTPSRKTRAPPTRSTTSTTTFPEKMAGHPRNVIFLTCDASGVMPPISRLTPGPGDLSLHLRLHQQDRRHRDRPRDRARDHLQHLLRRAVHGPPPLRLRRAARKKIVKHGATCWLVNTGWTGGPFGVGKRISIQHTRTLLNAALDGKLSDGRVPDRSDLRLRRADDLRGRARRDPRSGQHLGEPRGVLPEVRCARGPLHRELQADDGRVPGSRGGIRTEAAGRGSATVVL